MRVLIADNSKESREKIVGIFREFSPDIIIREVENGKQALRALTENSYDVIVTELEMEGGDGIVFIQHLQNSRLLKYKPIIIYSDQGYYETTVDNMLFVSKIATPHRELAEIIRELIFKYKICPHCNEAINFTTCNNICFYKHIDEKWRMKIRDLLK